MDVNTAKVAVIGIGNVLMGDDAAGPYLIKLLKARYEMPAQVALIDAGTAGLALPGMMAGYDAVILVDTVQADGAPGTVHRFDHAALLCAPCAQSITPHDSGVRDALSLSDLVGNGPKEAVLIGVVPDRTDGGIGLSPAVFAAMAPLVDAVTEELARLGMPVVPRNAPLEPELWWERGS
jgi:hydrogenase maturation protease